MKYTYSDPTGGGDDITLDAPAWAEPPVSIEVYDKDNRLYVFDLVD